MKLDTIWKAACIALLTYSVIGGLLMPVPALDILNETIRNLYFHVPMWFTMLALLTVSMVSSIRYLAKGELRMDHWTEASVHVSLQFGVLGLITGSLWAKFTWGDFWPPDPKLNAAAIAMLLYLTYPILRSTIQDEVLKARISSVLAIFAYPVYIALVFILPRMYASLHPGNGGNPGFNAYDLNSNMRLVFYPAVFGFILLGWWMTSHRAKMASLSKRMEELELSDTFLESKK
ncbi:MAG: cytochrome c biogenesis protein CcsA [Cytophagaceae bacterium]|nr:cytochrome c biogenesis protein CcsA [Cytophagaceae bacterium]